MTSTYKCLQIRPKTYSDLENIYQYSFRAFGQIKAEQYIRSLDRAFHKLNTDINLGNNYDHISNGLFAYVVASHIVFFRRSGGETIIIRVLHQSMDFNKHL